VLPLSPKLILPIPSGLKHMENEPEVYPLCAKVLGTDILDMPSPNKPLGAPPVKKEPVWTLPQLQKHSTFISKNCWNRFWNIIKNEEQGYGNERNDSSPSKKEYMHQTPSSFW
jgi:hypothetical protein